MKREGFILAHSSRVQSNVVEKSRQQEFEAAGHITYAVRKQGETHTGAQLSFTFQFMITARGMMPPIIWGEFYPLN